MYKIVSLEFMAHSKPDSAAGGELPQVITPADVGIRAVTADPFRLDDAKIRNMRNSLFALAIDEDASGEPDKATAYYYADAAFKAATRKPGASLVFDIANYVKLGGQHIMNMWIEYADGGTTTKVFPISRTYGSTPYSYKSFILVTIRLEKKDS